MEWKKNILYTGIAAASGVGGYLLGRSKSMRGVSLTLMAISMVLYMPKGCEVVNKHIDHKNNIEIRKMYIDAKKDSMDNILNYESIKKDSIYSLYNNMLKKDHATIDRRMMELNRGTNQLKNEITREKNELKTFYDRIQSERKVFEKFLEKYYEDE